jgi:hypothetical protein
LGRLPVLVLVLVVDPLLVKVGSALALVLVAGLLADRILGGLHVLPGLAAVELITLLVLLVLLVLPVLVVLRGAFGPVLQLVEDADNYPVFS